MCVPDHRDKRSGRAGVRGGGLEPVRGHTSCLLGLQVWALPLNAYSGVIPKAERSLSRPDSVPPPTRFRAIGSQERREPPAWEGSAEGEGRENRTLTELAGTSLKKVDLLGACQASERDGLPSEASASVFFLLLATCPRRPRFLRGPPTRLRRAAARRGWVEGASCSWLEQCSQTTADSPG